MRWQNNIQKPTKSDDAAGRIYDTKYKIQKFVRKIKLQFLVI